MMNSEQTDSRRLDVSVIGYADGIYNLQFEYPDGGVPWKVEVSETDALYFCRNADVKFPEPEPTEPEDWE